MSLCSCAYDDVWRVFLLIVWSTGVHDGGDVEDIERGLEGHRV